VVVGVITTGITRPENVTSPTLLDTGARWHVVPAQTSGLVQAGEQALDCATTS
jgi:hypothetical protein